ncbi:hypothetical protein DP094_023095 [Pseudomonas sp. MDMC17]|nr:MULTISPECIES: hypothetical protein [unclassified Pseudomonas]MDI6009821.1 hypothetical protein [Pseudomonas sp. MDMC17]
MIKKLAILMMLFICSVNVNSEETDIEKESKELDIYMGNSMCKQLPEENPLSCLNNFRASLAEGCILKNEKHSCADFIAITNNKIFQAWHLACDSLEAIGEGKYRRKWTC